MEFTSLPNKAPNLNTRNPANKIKAINKNSKTDRPLKSPDNKKNCIPPNSKNKLGDSNISWPDATVAVFNCKILDLKSITQETTPLQDI
jgi:hypothetical protein